MKYYRIGTTYLGGFDGAPSDPRAVECPAPENALDVWVGGKWKPCEEVIRADFKIDRATAVKNIKVEVNGKLFDGDETSQGRMARSLVALKDDETITWVLSDNTTAQVSKDDLLEALRLAGLKQTELWVLAEIAAAIAAIPIS